MLLKIIQILLYHNKDKMSKCQITHIERIQELIRGIRARCIDVE